MKYWKRFLIGGFLAWLFVNFLLILSIFITEAQEIRYDDYTAATIAYVLLIAAWPIGALLAYFRR